MPRLDRSYNTTYHVYLKLRCILLYYPCRGYWATYYSQGAGGYMKGPAKSHPLVGISQPLRPLWD
jgi:hypothetical protein